MKKETKSNYDVMRDQMRGEFVKYDQDKMIKKFSLTSDDNYIYLEFIKRPYRIGRQNGVVEWSEDGFVTAVEAGYNESMTIYDVLCYSRDDCHLAGKFCPSSMLKGTVQSSGPGSRMFKQTEEEFTGKLTELETALDKLGEVIDLKADLAAKINVFPFLPVIMQFWDADDEFPANLKFMFDENIISYMHFETTFFMLGHLIRRIKEMM